jgi:YebC/PmpR family DNA-binding regulatory protein
MSGHSHAANIKHKKAASDAKKGREFSRWAKAIMVAVKRGGADVDSNLALKYAIEKARAANMPKDTIDRAIKKGSGEGEGGEMAEILVEAIGPGGVAFMVELLTDNRNRTGPEIRKLIESRGGKVGGSGSVGWMFEKKGIIDVPQSAIGEDDLMTLVLDAGAEDMQTLDGFYEITTSPSAFWAVRKALEAKGLKPEVSEIMNLGKNKVEVTDAKVARKVLDMIDALEDYEDVQNVSTNSEIPDSVAAAAKAESNA